MDCGEKRLTKSALLQLEDDHSLFDYDVRQNDLIQIMVRKILPPMVSCCPDDSDNEKNSSSDKENVEVGMNSMSC